MRLRSYLFLLLLLLTGRASAQTENYNNQVRESILPWVQSVGQLFGLTDEGLQVLAWDDAYLTSCPRNEYLRMEAVVNNPAYYSCPTGYYRLQNERGGFIYLEAENPLAQKSTARSTGLSSIIKIERTADGGCYLKMQGYYLRTPLKDKAVTLTSVPEKFYPVVKEPGGIVTFTTKKGSYSALHCSTSNNIIGYTLADIASYWNVTPATEFTLTADVTHDGRYFHSFFAPFATRVEDGAQAFIMAEHEGKAVATSELTNIPASMPVLLRSDSKTMRMSIADDDHSVSPGNQALRNELADLSYYYFNKAYLLYSGDGNSNYTYYRETLSTKSKLYFWQQALVILMVEDRHDFRGDRSTASLITDLLDAFSAQEGGSGNGTAASRDAQERKLSDWTWNEYNDDLLWAGLAYIRGYLITGETRFLEQARWTWDFMYNRGWDEQLGGGIWWSIKKEEKSGLSNNPAICMACYLYEATGDEQYLDKAKEIYAWVKRRLRNADGSVDEKINADGSRPNSYNVYNQGTFVEGAANLFRLTGTTTYRADARKTIEYVMVNQVDSKGIMSRRKTDGTWQSEFARGMAAHLRACPDDWTYRGYYTTSRTRITYYDWMRLNADAAWETREKTMNLSDCEWNKQTPMYPSEGKTWECDAMASAVVMLNVTPEVLPGSADEVYVDIDDRSAEFAYVPEEDVEPEVYEPTFDVDEDGIMRVSAPIKIACVGNSITEGYGNSSQRAAWPAQTERRLGEEYQVTNFGKSGFCMGKKTDASYWTTSNFTNAKALNPDILIIALGTNDANPSRWGNTGGEFKQDYLDMIAEFRADGRNPIIFCALAPPHFPYATSNWNANIQNYLNPTIKSIAEETGSYVLDFSTLLRNRSDLFPDNLHPNDDGAAVMADYIKEQILQAQVLQGTVSVNDAAATEGTQAVVVAGDKVTLIPTLTLSDGIEGGSWKWTGPSNFTSTERIVTLTNVRTGGTYTVQFTDTDGHRSVVSFLVSVKGQKAGNITPYVQVLGDSWQQVNELTVHPGQTLNFGPQCSASGTLTWQWRGPNGFFATGREITISAMNKAKAGVYGVTVTDAQGRQTTATWTIRVEGELDCDELIPYISNGGWQQTTTAAVSAGANITFGPQPTDGEWTWTGPNGFTYTGREARVNSFNASKAGEYIATRTTEAGCYDQLIFTLTLK